MHKILTMGAVIALIATYSDLYGESDVIMAGPCDPTVSTCL